MNQNEGHGADEICRIAGVRGGSFGIYICRKYFHASRRSELVSELFLLEKFKNNPEIIGFVFANLYQDLDKLIVVVEKWDINLQEYIVKINTDGIKDLTVVMSLSSDIVNAIALIHEHGVCHGRITRASFALFRDTLKLLDFGYYAVEERQNFTEEMDVASCGKIIEDIAYGEMPLPQNDLLDNFLKGCCQENGILQSSSALLQHRFLNVYNENSILFGSED